MSGMDPKQGMEPRLIRDISKEISTECSKLRIYLGFTEPQFARLKLAYSDMDEQVFAMLNAWQDVVVRCGENPRHLLAAALQDCENRCLAVTKLVTPKELDGLTHREPREETKRQIEQINFSVHGDKTGPIYNIGAPNAVNVFGIFYNHGHLNLASNCSEKLFSGTGYSLEEACDYEKRQLNEIPAGCLVNLRGKQLVQEYVFNTQVRSDASAWVGIIMLGDVAGTCFRVGDKKIMTALHVIKLMLEKSYIPLHSGNQNLPVSAIFVKSGQQETQGQVDEPSQVAALSKLKDAYVDFSFVKDDQYRYKEHSVFNLKPLHSIKDVPFFDNGTDCIVLEILPNTKGTPMPLPFSLFSNPKLEEGFHIIGHPGGSKKTFDHVDGFIDRGKEETKKDIHTIKSESKKFLAKHGKDEHDYQFDVAHTIYSKDRFLFHCTSSQGASGAPGVVVDEDGRVFVVTMLLHGYPDWYYDPKSNGFKTEWPKQYCVEQGASMKAIFIQMQKEKPDLCKEIFDQRGN